MHIKRTFLLTSVLAGLGTIASAGVSLSRQPKIYLNYFSRDTAVDTSKVRIRVDGKDVTKLARVTSHRVTYVPSQPLEPGEHTVVVVVVDLKGHRGVKRWSFTVDPDARDVDGPVLRFVSPTPANGAVVSGSARVAVTMDDGDGVGVDRASVKVELSRDRGGFEDVTGYAVVQPRSIIVEVPTEPAGVRIIRVQARDLVGNRSRTVMTSFSIDTTPPSFDRIYVVPNPFTPSRRSHSRKTAKIMAQVRDDPFEEVRRASVVVTKGQGWVVRRLEAVVSQGVALAYWDGKDNDGDFVNDGIYRLTWYATDYAGHTTTKDWLGRLHVGSYGKARRIQLVLDPVTSPRRDPHVDISGSTGKGLLVDIFVNDRPVGSVKAAASGRFNLPQVTLREGANHISAVATGREHVRTSEEVVLDRPVVLDTRPPTIVEIRPSEGERISAYGAEIVVVFDDAGGSGIDPDRLLFRLDGRDVARSARVRGDVVSHVLSRAERSPGEHTVEVRVTDKAGNVSERRYWNFTLTPDVAGAGVRPVVLQPRPGTLVSSTSVDIRGRAQPGSRLRVFVNHVERAEVQVDRAGAFTVRRVQLEPGLNTIYVEVPDYGKSREVTVSQAAWSTVPTIQLPTYRTKITASSLDLRGRAQPGTLLRIFVNQVERTAVRVDLGGTYRAPRVPLEPGQNTIYVEGPDHLRSGTVTVTRR